LAKVPTQFRGEVIVFLTKWCWDNMQRNEIGSCIMPYEKITKKWIKIPNAMAKTIKLLEENIGVKFL
jgi:hypothetical protein